MNDILAKLRIELVDDIGVEGRNSKVYRALDPQLGADIAIKIVPKSDFPNDQEYFNEARTLYFIQHPNVVEINYACEDDDNVYLSMPYYKHGSLNALLNERHLTVQEIISYSLDFLSGLHYVHTKGLIHFDVKPTNVLISDSGRGLLTDFGLSKYVNTLGLAEPDKLYTHHMAPENLMQQHVTNAVDIYQAGLTLYRMCNGNENFRHQLSTITNIPDSIMSGAFPDRRYYLPHIPNKLRKVVNNALGGTVTDRYETVLDLINDLSDIDDNLHWVYDGNTSSHSWQLEQTNHNLRITLSKDGQLYNINGTKIRKSDGVSTNVSAFRAQGIPDQTKAFKAVAKMIANA